jgi:hypothetical protein
MNVPFPVFDAIYQLCDKRGVMPIKAAIHSTDYGIKNSHLLQFLYAHPAQKYQGLSRPSAEKIELTYEIDGQKIQVIGYEILDHFRDIEKGGKPLEFNYPETLHYGIDLAQDLWANGPHVEDVSYATFLERTAKNVAAIAAARVRCLVMEARYIEELTSANLVLKDPTVNQHPAGLLRNLQLAVLYPLLRARSIRVHMSPIVAVERALEAVPALMRDEIIHYLTSDEQPRSTFSVALKGYIERVIEDGALDQSMVGNAMTDEEVEATLRDIFSDLRFGAKLN